MNKLFLNNIIARLSDLEDMSLLSLKIIINII